MIHSVDSHKIKKILVITLSNIGDVVLTTPVFSILRKQFPGSFITAAVGPKAVSLIQGSETVDEVVVFDKKVSWFGWMRFFLGLYQKRFDLVVDLRNTVLPLLLMPSYRTSFQTSSKKQTMRQRHLDRIRFLVSANGEEENHFHFFSEREKENAVQKAEQLLGLPLKHFVLMAPGARSGVKRWTKEGFSETARYFLKAGKQMILAGDASESESIEAVRADLKGTVACLTGLLTLRELAALVSQAELVISNDSAVMHLAHELNRPTVSVFGPTDEAKYAGTGSLRRSVRLHLDCAPCEKAQCHLPKRICLDELPAFQVIQAAEELLHAHSV